MLGVGLRIQRLSSVLCLVPTLVASCAINSSRALLNRDCCVLGIPSDKLRRAASLPDMHSGLPGCSALPAKAPTSCPGAHNPQVKAACPHLTHALAHVPGRAGQGACWPATQARWWCMQPLHPSSLSRCSSSTSTRPRHAQAQAVSDSGFSALPELQATIHHCSQQPARVCRQFTVHPL